MSQASQAYVIGTAGHIDHGKTSLVQALTGIDTDRLKEEKERGITIELGFAHLALPRHGVVGVVDVPGHERFVRTMVAGAVGIDLVLLVVAADEGVMPQTREHLDICQLLGIRRGVVALTKCDLVEEELLDLAVEDVRAVLRGTALEGAPLVPCSARSGAGLAELVRALDDQLARAAQGRDSGGLLRLPVDRVFTIKGFGTVATGTLWSGRLQVGDELVALPGPRTGTAPAPAKVRGLQVHGQPVAAALAGQRTAVNLVISRELLERGETLVRPGTLEAGLRLDVRLHHLKTARAPLKRRSRVLLHAGTTQRLALVVLLEGEELVPGGSALAQVHLTEALPCQPGDRFILRGFSMQKNHGTTLGGGEVLRVMSARQRRGAPALLDRLRAVEAALRDLAERSGAGAEAAERELLRLEVERSGVQGVTLQRLLGRLPLARKRVLVGLERLSTGRQLLQLSSGEDEHLYYAGQPALRLAQEAVLVVVGRHHQGAPLQPGLPREALLQQIGPRGGDREGVGEGPPRLLHPRLLARAVEGLIKEGRLVAQRDLVHLPDHAPERQQAEGPPLGERLRGRLQEAGLAPPRLEELAVELAAPLADLKATVERLLREGALLRVKDMLFAKPVVDALRERLVAYLREHGTVDAQRWKELVGQSRKYAIPLAEHFDAEKVTLRVGDLRKLRG